MAGFQHVDEVLDLCVNHLPICGLVQFATCCKAGYALAAERAQALLSLENDCLHFRTTVPKHLNCLTRWIMLRSALRPRCLVSGHRKDWPDKTIPFKFVVDSKGPMFIECQMTVAKGSNGSPLVGLVDAESPLLTKDVDKSFSITFSPIAGHMRATIDRSCSSQLTECDLPMPTAGPSMECVRAKLAWDRLSNEQDKRNTPVSFGLFVENGQLAFYRRSHCGCWRSSGFICRNLPAKVLPCVFLRSFMGFTRTRLIGVQESPPSGALDDAGYSLEDGWSSGLW